MRHTVYMLGCACVAALSGAAAAQQVPADSPRVQAAKLEDERERLTKAQASIAAQLAALPKAAAPAAAKPDAGADQTPFTTTKTPEGPRSFAGLKLGVGLSFTLDVGKLDRISEAEIVDGIVRVKDQNNGRARIMLESHYFFTGEGQRGWGPFVAIQPGSGEIIDAIGMGIMVGFRRDEKSTESFNLGFGVVIDPNTRVLGDGFRANQAPPGTETEVRYRETLQTGILLLTSFSF